MIKNGEAACHREPTVSGLQSMGEAATAWPLGHTVSKQPEQKRGLSVLAGKLALHRNNISDLLCGITHLQKQLKVLRTVP